MSESGFEKYNRQIRIGELRFTNIIAKSGLENCDSQNALTKSGFENCDSKNMISESRIVIRKMCLPNPDLRITIHKIEFPNPDLRITIRKIEFPNRELRFAESLTESGFENCNSPFSRLNSISANLVSAFCESQSIRKLYFANCNPQYLSNCNSDN
jgi:hypothetical protein